jgi:hypothetical protein
MHTSIHAFAQRKERVARGACSHEGGLKWQLVSVVKQTVFVDVSEPVEGSQPMYIARSGRCARPHAG